MITIYGVIHQVSLWYSMMHSVSAALTCTLLTNDGELEAFPN